MNIKHFAIILLTGGALLSSSFAGPATWGPLPKVTTPPVSRPVTIALSGHTTKQPYLGAGSIGPTRLFNAGQGVVSVPY